MKRYLFILLCTLSTLSLSAQRDHHDRLRYDQMNEQGVWSIGVSMSPVVGIRHPLSPSLGGGAVCTTGIMGFGIEGGYFIADNMRLSATLEWANDAWGNFLTFYDGYTELSQFHLNLGAHWHMGRWDVGGALVMGNTTFRYFAADTENGGINIDRYGDSSLRDRHALLGISYQAGYMISPFLKVGAYYQPTIALGAGYSHTFGAKLTIYLPFINAVVCK